ncbi:MAG: hypothetical protein JNK47_18295 [Mesorhizobium sp.]|nr:hypothetical protein [Mesorhizobium sp.]MBL8579174.1 hypothetical protein [Mesorhizobium sp.]
MVLTFQHRLFETYLCSDNEPDSMYLEVTEVIEGKKVPVLEIRYLEDGGAMTFTAFKDNLPFELIEHYGQSARVSLTPVVDAAAE